MSYERPVVQIDLPPIKDVEPRSDSTMFRLGEVSVSSEVEFQMRFEGLPEQAPNGFVIKIKEKGGSAVATGNMYLERRSDKRLVFRNHPLHVYRTGEFVVQLGVIDAKNAGTGVNVSFLTVIRTYEIVVKE